MNHPTHEELTLLLYGEENENSGLSAHLSNCPECRERFRKLKIVAVALDSFNVEERENFVDASRIVDAQGPIRHSFFPRTISGFGLSAGSAVMVASMFVLVGGFSFLMGVSFQSRQSADRIKEQIAVAVADVQARERDEDRELDSGLVLTFQNQFAKLEKSFAQQRAASLAQNLSALDNIESQFSLISLEQNLLRRDLQTLAVNAEGEIASAQNDIRRIDEFVSVLVPLGN